MVEKEPEEESELEGKATVETEGVSDEDAETGNTEEEAPETEAEAEGEEDEQLDADATLMHMPAIKLGASKAPVHYAPVLLTLLGESTPQRMVLEQPEVVIGRSKECDFTLADSAASRQHAKIIYTNAGDINAKPQLIIYDLKSRNGVTVNGFKVDGHVPLRDNARINIGDTQLGYFILTIQQRVDGDAEADSVDDAAKTSEEGAGTEAPSPPSSSRAEIAMPKANAPRIAVVESDYEFASDLKSRLEETGNYSVIVFRNVQNALETFRMRPPNMLLLDGNMEGQDFLDICSNLKDDPKTAPIPIIILFKEMDGQMVRAGLKAGAQSYLIKPIDDLSRLTHRIDIHMNINRMMSGLGK